MTKPLYFKLQVKQLHFSQPSDVNATLSVGGVNIGFQKYYSFENMNPDNGWPLGTIWGEFEVIATSFTKPPTWGTDVLSYQGFQAPGWTGQAWQNPVNVPDNFDPGDPDNPNPPPTDDPVDLRDYYTYFSSDKSGQIYDSNGVKVPQKGAYQALETAGEALIREMLDLGPYDDFDPYWPTVDLIDNILSQTSNAQAVVDVLRSTLKAVKALNGGGRIAERDAADIAADLNATWWKPQQALAYKLEAHLQTLVGFDDPAARLAVKQAFAAWSLGVEKSSGGRSDTAVQNSTNQDLGDFIGFQFDRSTTIAGSIFDDVILLPKGGLAFMGPGDDTFAANYYGLSDKHAATVYGGTGHDQFDGSRKSDTLYGEKGNDSIHGANGADTMSGGAGVDQFYYFLVGESGVGKGKRDVIVDFKHGQDKFYFHAKSDTNSAFVDAHFGGKTKKFDGTVGQIIWHQDNKAGTANDRTYVRMDTDGDGKTNLEIELKGLVKLTAGDFIL